MVQKSFVLYGLLTALLAVSAASARTFTAHSNKNILRQRSAQSNIAMEYSSSHEHLYGAQPGNIHTHMLFTPFYQASQRSLDLGNYFGVGNGSNKFVLGAPGAGIDVNALSLIHELVASATATVAFKPEQQSYGTRIDLMQDINSPVKGMFFRASTTALHVQNNVKVAYTGLVPAAANYNLDFPTFFAGQGNEATLIAAGRQQVGLTKARIPGGRRSKTGLADIDLSLGYKCVHSATSHAFLSMDMTLPTGNRVLGDYLFEPQIGNGRHFGLGASFDGGIEAWKNNVGTLRFDAALRYKYMFQNNEQRTLSLRSDLVPGTVLNNASKYFATGIKNAPLKTPLFPLANISTMNIAVKPGHQLDMLAAMSFNSGKFSVDVGYNPFWHDAESVRINSAFDDARYAVAATNYNVATAAAKFGGTPATDFAPGLSTITSDSFDLEGIRTPALLSHKLFLAGNYAWHIYGKSLMSVGLGASYEFATSNADVEQYGLWGKVNLSF